jgi:hypothetical protein
MTQLYDQAVPIVNLPFLYINGLVCSNDATTPNTILDVSAGVCRDSSNTYDMNLGNYNGQTNITAAENVATLINAAVIGYNGIDTGTFAAATLYYVYVISDPVSGNPSGAMISISPPNTGPLMPFGYSAYRHIGYAVTASGAAHFLPFYQTGNNNAREFTFDAPQATAVTAGAATAYTAVSLLKWVPNLPINQQVNIYYSYVPATAGNQLSMQALFGTAAQQVITGQVAAVAVTGVVEVIAQQTTSSTIQPEINYKVGNASDAVAIDVAGFKFFI